MTLGTILRGKRTTEGWTQDEIATRAGRFGGKDVDQTHVSYWERDGIKRPTGDQLRMLAHAYKLPVVELVIAAGYLTRRDLDMPLDPPDAATTLPDDPLELMERIAELNHRLDIAIRADRASHEHPDKSAERA